MPKRIQRFKKRCLTQQVLLSEKNSVKNSSIDVKIVILIETFYLTFLSLWENLTKTDSTKLASQ